MNKEEKIGMYTRNEIFEHLCENSDIGMLGRSMYDAVMSKIDNLQSQLDIANKKLEEVREYIKENACYDEKTKECKCSFSSMALDNILSIIGGE